ncbi:hypothetical protein V6N12_075741 [Hibiscus sabdariffa]|uniref:PHD finger-like domain-containing protein 5A n=1 Tax=Hibiscus sabdariffa TaxID=183260 RepID=A0ABR2C9Z9_9ROSI
MCRKQPGIAIGRLCEKCDGKCVICDSYVRPCTLVRVCDECNYGSFQGRCVICGGVGISDAYYCKECTQQEKDRDGCPKIVNLGSAKTDLFYELLLDIGAQNVYLKPSKSKTISAITAASLKKHLPVERNLPSCFDQRIEPELGDGILLGEERRSLITNIDDYNEPSANRGHDPPSRTGGGGGNGRGHRKGRKG